MIEKKESSYLQRIMAMAEESGKIADAYIDNSKPCLKADDSVLTKADMAVSEYIKDSLSDILSLENHSLIDEEDSNNQRYCDQKYLNNIEYLWAVDPIDGTRAYSNKMPLYGFSLGLLKDLKPWIGVVYFPQLKELFYNDGTEAFFVRNPFTENAEKFKIVPIDQKITQQSVFFLTDTFLKDFSWNFSFCQIMLPACAVINLCWPAIGRSCGYFFRANLWDFAGAWPVFKAAGLDLRSFTTGDILDCVNVDLFQNKGLHPWKLKEYYILSSKRNYSLIRNNITKTTCCTNSI